MNSEHREKIGGIFLNPKISVLPEKGIFTDFNKMFPNKFIVVTDNVSNPPLQYNIQKIFFVYLQRMLIKNVEKIR